MTPITENSIEEFAIELLEKLGYESVYGPDIAPDNEFSTSFGATSDKRESYEQVLLNNRLRKALKRINRNMPADVLEDAIKEIQRIHSPELLTNNETFHRFLTEGIPVSKRVDGEDRGDLVWLIDFKNPYNNDFLVVNQFTVVENNHPKRPDIVLFVNGIPLVVIELKNAADENASIRMAFKQIETYKALIPTLFTYNGFVVISDGLEAKAGTISSGFSRFMAWKSSDGQVEASHLVSQLETLIEGMLNKETLIDLMRHFIVFEKTKKEDPVTGIITMNTVKKMAAYHQYCIAAEFRRDADHRTPCLATRAAQQDHRLHVDHGLARHYLLVCARLRVFPCLQRAQPQTLLRRLRLDLFHVDRLPRFPRFHRHADVALHHAATAKRPLHAAAPFRI